VTLPRDRFGEFTGCVSILFEVAAAHRDHFHAQPAQLAQIAPHGGEIELTIGGGIWKHRHQIPVAIRAVGLQGAAAEQPDLFRIEYLDDALDDARWDSRDDHTCKGSEFWLAEQA
jgi:hypothetical protein